MGLPGKSILGSQGLRTRYPGSALLSLFLVGRVPLLK